MSIATDDEYTTPVADHIISMNLTSEKIRMIHLRLFTSMDLGADMIIRLLGKIENYMYISNLHSIVFGSIVRILQTFEIPSEMPKMHVPCIVCDIVLTDEHPLIRLKTLYSNRYFSISMLNCIVFQKLTPEEQLILSALDYSARQDQEWMSDSDDELSDDEESVAASNNNVNDTDIYSDTNSDNWDVIYP